MLYIKSLKIVNPEFSQGKKIFSFILYLYEMTDIH